jgi:hypothetical protein
MNETNRKSGEPASAGSDQEIKRLAAIIRENRVALDHGWEELARLNRVLAGPGKAELKTDRPENLPAPQAEPAGPQDPASEVVVKE